MEKFKQCRQCGEIRAESQFRKYYGSNRKGHYKTCLSCEKVNSRHKYLRKKPDLTEAETSDLQLIERLYDVQRQQGLKPPSTRNEPVLDIEQLLVAQERSREPVTESTPVELLEWLEKDLSSYTPDELDGIGDDLMGKYRPQIGVDETYKPIYDDSHRDTLRDILKRFDDYEDEYEYE